MRVGLAQINPTVGDIQGNADLILRSAEDAVRQQCDVVLYPELSLSGYPPEDLLFKSSFIEENRRTLRRLAAGIKNIAAIVGTIDGDSRHLFNAAAWIQNGKIHEIYHKQNLPNYGVFDEKRYFTEGKRFLVKSLDGVRVGLTICEDIWMGESALTPLKRERPQIVFNISASPYHVRKIQERRSVVARAARYLNTPLAYCNLMGGQDELVFDGGSFTTSSKGKVIFQAPLFKSGLFTFDVNPKDSSLRNQIAGLPDEIDEMYQALLLGVRDYTGKNRFEKVAVGISGGIDSALVAALAAKALGPDRVIGVSMPSKFNQAETRHDAKTLAENLGIRYVEIPIQDIFETNLRQLSFLFAGTKPNTAEENLQARVRGNLLMALSNKFNWLVLTTGNKSEMSTGYCTLYGDTAGGFAVLKDVLKTNVYRLSKHINAQNKRPLIPTSIIERAPSAELNYNQKDEDALGSYADLDPLITGYVENNLSIKALHKKLPHLPVAYIEKVIRLIDKSEYKRRQAPPGIKISARSFGRDHRMPITNRFKEESISD